MAVRPEDDVAREDIALLGKEGVLDAHPSHFPVQHSLFFGELPAVLGLFRRGDVLVGGEMIGRKAHRSGSNTLSAPISLNDAAAGAPVMSFAKAKSTFTWQISPSMAFCDEWAAMIALTTFFPYKRTPFETPSGRGG